jgi:hypothetical protein
MSLITVLSLLALNGCASPSVTQGSAFSTPVKRNFSEDVLQKTKLYKDTTANKELWEKYRADWLAIEDQIADYEYQLQVQE